MQAVADTIELVAGMIVDQLSDLEDFDAAIVTTAFLHVVAFLVVSSGRPEEWLVALGHLIDERLKHLEGDDYER